MRLLSFIILFLLATASRVYSQNKTEYYSDDNDTTFKFSSYVFSASLILKPDKVFVYNIKAKGDCHYCYFITKKGTWSLKNDTIILLYTYSYQRDEVYPAVSIYDSLVKDVFITVRSESGDVIPNVKITAHYAVKLIDYYDVKISDDYGWSEPIEYLTDSNGLITLKRDSLKLFKIEKDFFVRLNFEYKMPNGEINSRNSLFKLPYNNISFKIYYTPVYTTEVQTIYYLKSQRGLTQVQRHNTKDGIDYWGNMKLCENSSCITPIK